MMEDPGALLERLYRKVDRFFEAARVAQPDAVRCEPGCTSCCEVDLTVFRVEAAGIEAGFAALPRPVQREAAVRAGRTPFCAMLDPDSLRCIVYDARPLICRSHGLALLVDGRVDYCSLNYSEQPPQAGHVMVLERINEVLVLTDRLAGGDGRRVRLADIAARLGQ